MGLWAYYTGVLHVCQHCTSICVSFLWKWGAMCMQGWPLWKALLRYQSLDHNRISDNVDMVSCPNISQPNVSVQLRHVISKIFTVFQSRLWAHSRSSRACGALFMDSYPNLNQHKDNTEGAQVFVRVIVGKCYSWRVSRRNGQKHSATNVFSCNSRSTNEGNNQTALSLTKEPFGSKDRKLKEHLGIW